MRETGRKKEKEGGMGRDRKEGREGRRKRGRVEGKKD